MQKKGPKNYPVEEAKLARLRRKYTTILVSKRARISRTTLTKIEQGDPAVTLASYARVLSVLGFLPDIDLLAANDVLGRKLQDLELRKSRKPET